MSDVLSLEAQIKVQREYMWSSAAYSLFVLILGVGITVYLYFTDNSLGTKVPEVLKVGPLFISGAVTALPWKTFMQCRARMASYKTLESNFKNLSIKAQKEILSQVMTEALKQTVKID